MLLSGSLTGSKSSTPDFLMVNLVGKSVLSSRQQKSLVAPQIKASSSSERDSSSAVIEPHAISDSKGAGRLVAGAARQAIHSPKPHYPLASRRLKEQGLVIARLCVSDQGLVQEVGITHSSGFQGLDRSALTALAQWRFSPATPNSDRHSSQCFQTPVQFTLEG